MYPYPHTLELVREFHKIFKQPIAGRPTCSALATRKLRVALIAEELGELCQALGVSLNLMVVPDVPGSTAANTSNGYRALISVGEHCLPDEQVDLVEAADALGDLDYVVQGSNLAFGVSSGTDST